VVRQIPDRYYLVSSIVGESYLQLSARYRNVGSNHSAILPRWSQIVWPLPPVTLNPMRSRKPVRLRPLTIAFLLALTLVLSACGQTGSTPGVKSGSTGEPTVAPESCAWRRPWTTRRPRGGVRAYGGRSSDSSGAARICEQPPERRYPSDQDGGLTTPTGWRSSGVPA